MTINHKPSAIRTLVGWAAPTILACLLATDATAQGRLERINGYLVLHVAGTPTEMGEQHGRLLRPLIQRMVQDLIVRGEGWTEDAYKALIQGSRVMEKHLPSDFREELRALAKAADVKYDDLVAAQLFGDVRRAMPAPLPAEAGISDFRFQISDLGPDEPIENRKPRTQHPTSGHSRPHAHTPKRPHRLSRHGLESAVSLDHQPSTINPSPLCTSFAMLGPATATGECIAGRNLDYWDQGVSEYAAVLIHFTPKNGRPFVTVTWAGIINGWTLMNADGLCCSNNTSYDSRSDSLEGISTCFMLRKVAQFCRRVEEGVEVVRKGPRACGTNMLIAGGNPPNAAIVEFDHVGCAVRWARNGYVMGTNSFRTLYQEPPQPDDDGFGRYEVLLGLIRQNFGRIDPTMNFAAAPGVAIAPINLHSAMLYPKSLRFQVSMGRMPACEQPYRKFRMTERGVVSDEEK